MLHLLLGGCLDLIRGNVNPKALWMIVHGIFLATISLGTSEGLLPIAVLGLMLALGAAPGWGQPIGHTMNYGTRPIDQEDGFEWWQGKYLQKNTGPLSLIVRGLLWGLPGAILVPFLGLPALYPMIALAISMPMSALVVHVTLREYHKRWEAHEFLRGIITAFIILYVIQ